MSWAERARAAPWRVPVGLQLSVLYTLLLVAILALLGWALYAQLDRFMVQNTADRVERAAEAALTPSPSGNYGGHRDPGRHDGPNTGPQPPGGFGRGSAPEPLGSILVRELSGTDVTVAVLDEQGTVLSSTLDFNDEEARVLPALPAGWLAQVPHGTGNDSAAQWVVPDGSGGRLLVVVEGIANTAAGAEEPGRLLLLQAASLDGADAILAELRLYLALGLLIGTVVGVLAGLALTRAVLRPLDRMARTAEAIAGGDLNRRLHLPAGRNEIARLGSAFDHMVERLAATLQAQRRFIADASHELRTPLTSLEGLSEMLLIGADRGDSRTIQRTARSMHGELGRMGRLVSDLLTLSRLDSAAPLSLGRVDAGRLLDDVAEQVGPVAEAAQVRLEVSHAGPVPVRADADRLKQVLLNLVDNALRYTPPEGTVRLSAALDPAAGIAHIQIQDTGPGIAPADLPHIFDRFYRGDPSRARASGNTGLGLAIAHSIVQAHGGMLTVQSAPGAGTCFTVTLPAERPGEPPRPITPHKRDPHSVRQL